MSTMWWLFPLLLFLVFNPFRRRRRLGYWPDWDGRVERGRPRQQEESETDEATLQRNNQIEQLESRVAELESRLDFAERLLAQRREAPVMSGQAAP